MCCACELAHTWVQVFTEASGAEVPGGCELSDVGAGTKPRFFLMRTWASNSWCITPVPSCCILNIFMLAQIVLQAHNDFSTWDNASFFSTAWYKRLIHSTTHYCAFVSCNQMVRTKTHLLWHPRLSESTNPEHCGDMLFWCEFSSPFRVHGHVTMFKLVSKIPDVSNQRSVCKQSGVWLCL